MLIPANAIKNEFAFIACSHRIGTAKRVGPSSGKTHQITMQGIWIPEADADELVYQLAEVWCSKAGKNIEIQPFFYLGPTAQQLEQNPGEKNET